MSIEIQESARSKADGGHHGIVEWTIFMWLEKKTCW